MFFNIVFLFLSVADKGFFLSSFFLLIRLPKEEDWSSHGQPFKLTKKNGGDGAGYPLAHTCFFQLEVPEYSSDEVAVKRLKFCATIAAGMGFGFA